ncbi:AAA family ATPase [Anaerosporobacter faecicola]|uniref:AAA family ATPase n=1 Tax=Anaerosporobacter faecicola TaxID=2718714 RepID=UPI00143BAF1D|nr:AAA family ATPase [Anaerosporobacter faecicola]
MIYLRKFVVPDAEQESDFTMSVRRNCYSTFYPFQVLSKHRLEEIEFDPITIFYGGNGCGKSTALNVIAEKLQVKRESSFNQSNFYQDYVDLCQASLLEDLPEHCQIITSDDIFDFMLNIRAVNEGVDTKREELFEEYMDAKYAKFQFRTMEDYDKLKKVNQARSKTQSKFVRDNLMNNIREYSNGENAYRYFIGKIEEDGLYLLDEPENSLSPERQLELKKYLEESARYCGCQFIISTHSPFLLALDHAKIYDFDEDPVTVKPWTQLKNVRTYHDFFKHHEGEF